MNAFIGYLVIFFAKVFHLILITSGRKTPLRSLLKHKLPFGLLPVPPYPLVLPFRLPACLNTGNHPLDYVRDCGLLVGSKGMEVGYGIHWINPARPIPPCSQGIHTCYLQLGRVWHLSRRDTWI